MIDNFQCEKLPEDLMIKELKLSRISRQTSSRDQTSVNSCVTEQSPRLEISTKHQIDNYLKAVTWITRKTKRDN